MSQKDFKIGTNIRLIRQSKGITATFVASKLDKSPQWLSNIEKNKRQISIDDLINIAAVLGEDINIFLPPPTTQRLINLPTGTDS